MVENNTNVSTKTPDSSPFLSKTQINEYYRTHKEGATSKVPKEKFEEIIANKIKDIDSLDSEHFAASKETGESFQLFGSSNLEVFSQEAKDKYINLVNSLANNFADATNKNSAFICRKEGEEARNKLFQLLNLSADDDDELKKAQFIARDLIKQVGVEALSSSTLDSAESAAALDLLDNNPDTKLEAIKEIVRSYSNMEDLQKINKGLLGKINRSGGQFGKLLAKYAQHQIGHLVTSPLNIDEDDDIGSETRELINELRQEIFSKAVVPVQEGLEKSITKMKLRAEDSQRPYQLIDTLGSIYCAEDKEEAATAARAFEEQMSYISTGEETAKHVGDSAKKLIKKLNTAKSGRKQPFVYIPKEVIEKANDEDKKALKDAWYNSLVEQSQKILNQKSEYTAVEVSKREVSRKLDEYISEAGDGTVSLTVGTSDISINKEQLEKIKKSLTDELKSEATWNEKSEGNPGSSAQEIVNAIKSKIENAKKLTNLDKLQRAQEIVDVHGNNVSDLSLYLNLDKYIGTPINDEGATLTKEMIETAKATFDPAADSGKGKFAEARNESGTEFGWLNTIREKVRTDFQSQEKVTQVLAKETGWNYNAKDGNEVKATNELLNTVFKDVKKKSELDVKYFRGIYSGIVDKVLKPFQLKAPSIASTAVLDVINTIIDKDGGIDEDESLSGASKLDENAANEIKSLVADAEADLDSNIASATIPVDKIYDETFRALGKENYKEYIKSLGLGNIVGTALQNFVSKIEAINKKDSSIAKLNKKEVALLDDTYDHDLHPTEQKAKEVERAILIASKINDIKTKKNIDSDAKQLVDEIKSSSIDDSTLKPVKSKLTNLKSNSINQIEKARKELEKLREADTSDIWSLYDVADTPKAIKDVLDTLIKSYKKVINSTITILGGKSKSVTELLANRLKKTDELQGRSAVIKMALDEKIVSTENKDIDIAKVSAESNEDGDPQARTIVPGYFG